MSAQFPITLAEVLAPRIQGESHQSNRNFIPLSSAVPSPFDALVGRCLWRQPGRCCCSVVFSLDLPGGVCVEIRGEREAGESGKRFHLRAAEINGADVPI